MVSDTHTAANFLRALTRRGEELDRVATIEEVQPDFAGLKNTLGKVYGTSAARLPTVHFVKGFKNKAIEAGWVEEDEDGECQITDEGISALDHSDDISRGWQKSTKKHSEKRVAAVKKLSESNPSHIKGRKTKAEYEQTKKEESEDDEPAPPPPSDDER